MDEQNVGRKQAELRREIDGALVGHGELIDGKAHAGREIGEGARAMGEKDSFGGMLGEMHRGAASERA